MRYAILGTTQAHRRDGTAVPLGGSRLRALVAALALRPGRTVGPAALIADVWGPEPPEDATGALQALVGRTRRTLGRDAVVSGPGGYRLAADTEDVDLHRFDRLAREGTEALAAGDPDKAVGILEEALALWRGPALADLPEARAEAARADERLLDARLARHTCDLRLGRPERALPALATLCEAHPLHEPLQELRIRALRDAGRPAEALAAYEEVRAGLADRLGTDPGPALRDLHARLLRPGPAPAEPATPAPAPPPVATRPPGNLRARLTSFVGRESDLAALRGALATHRLVTLLGPGGAGKTRLSLEAAERAALADPDTWPHGVWCAELAPVRDPDTVAEAVLTALGARETVVRGMAAEGLRAAADPTALDPPARLVEHCGSRRMLLILDNCEHVVAAVAELTARLLAECPEVTVLATSREPLAVPGELVRPVEPLPASVALRLLAERGAAARPGFRVADDPAACEEICRRLDGLPLAVELAAARLRMLGPRQLADRLDDRFRLLTSGSRTALPRQQTLRAVVDWSWDLLETRERAVLRRLSVCAGGCDLAAAEAVCADDADTDAGTEGSAADRVARRDVAALLGSLIDKSLVVAASAAEGRMRYGLLETVAEYAAERLDEAGERARAERRHLVAFRELARHADPLLRGPGQRKWLERLEAEHDNLRTALRRAVAAGDEHEGLSLVLALYWFWTLRDHRVEALTWSTAVAGLGPDPFAAPVTPAPPLHERPTDQPPPLSREQLLEARRQIRIVALTFSDGGAGGMGDPETRARMKGVLAAYRGGLPQTCRPPGSLWFFALMLCGRVADLRKEADVTVRTCRGLGLDWELAMSLQLRAKLLNDHPEAMDLADADADEALRIFERLGDAWGTAEALSGRGEVREGKGEFARAAEDYRAAMRRAGDVGAHGQIPQLKARLGGALIEAGEEGEGVALLREVIDSEEPDRRDASAIARLVLARWLSTVGEAAEAGEQLRAVERQFTHTGAPELFWGMLGAARVGVDVDAGCRDGDLLVRTRAAMETLRDPLAEVVAPDFPVTHLVVAARALMAVDEARAADAARLLGAHDALWAPGRPTDRALRRHRALAEGRARALLGEAAWSRAHAEGGALGLAEAAALV